MDHAEFIKRVKSNIKTPNKDTEEQLEQFCSFCSYVQGEKYDEDKYYEGLEKHLSELEQKNNQKETNRIFYMALPPSVFIDVSQMLKKHCYPKNGIARIIVSIFCSTNLSYC
jgi:glucose-6-phosphate 1-dehydrogenase